MAKFIELTDKFGFSRLVNVDHIVDVHYVDDLTRVYLSIKIEANSHYIKVKETPEEIKALIHCPD